MKKISKKAVAEIFSITENQVRNILRNIFKKGKENG